MKANECNEVVNAMRGKSYNKSCFDCTEKGVNYVVLDFGTFVCSSCSGIHRQLNHKVKGLGMSNFAQKDVDMLNKNGNKRAKSYWLSEYNKTLYPIPDRTNAVRMKEFMKLKYEQKRFMDKNAAEKEEDSEEDEAPKPKKDKKKKKKVVSSSDEESSSEESEEEKPKFRKRK